jgi:hypothetical protein
MRNYSNVVSNTGDLECLQLLRLQTHIGRLTYTVHSLETVYLDSSADSPALFPVVLRC